MRLMSGAVLVLAASLVAAPTASAQLSPHIVVALGASAPTGDFGKAVKMGYNVTGGLALSAPLIPVGVRVEGMYNAFDSKTAGAGTAKVSAGTLNATFGGAMLPLFYAIGGVGIYHFAPLPAGAENNKFGWNLGAGVKIPLTGFGAHVEARYHSVSANGGTTSFIPITFGVTF